MSLGDEVLYFFRENKKLESDESWARGAEGRISAGDISNWAGAIFLTQYRVCIASEPGMISQGITAWSGYMSMEAITFNYGSIDVWIRGQKITIEIERSEIPKLRDYFEKARAQCVDAKVLDPWKAAMKAWDAEQYEAALRHLTRVAELDTISAMPHAARAEIFYASKQFENVGPAVEEALRRRYEKTGELKTFRGLALLELGRLQEAETELQVAYKEGGGANALQGVFSVQVQLKRLDDAHLTAQELVRLEPSNEAFVRVHVTLLCEKRASVSEISSCLGQYRNLQDCKAGIVALVEAHLAEQEGQYQKAREKLALIPRGSPEYESGLSLLMAVAAAQKDYVVVEQTAKHIEALADADHASEKIDALEALIEAQLQLARWTESLGSAERLEQIVGTNDPQRMVNVRYARAVARTLSGNLAEAATAIPAAREDLVDASSGNLNARFWQRTYVLDYLEARLALRAGRRDEARKLFRLSSRLDSIAGPLQKAIAGDVRKRLADDQLASVPTAGGASPAAQSGVADGKRDLTLRAVATLEQRLARVSRLQAYGLRLRDLKHHMEQPLLVAVMGEFNAGKSTFINALLGISVLPMDVVPTTATINVLAYADQASARISWRDGSTEDVPVEDLQRYINEQQDTAGRDLIRKIHHVEIRQPVPLLQALNFVDTPGLNALTEEHQQITTDYLLSVDAILWLFRADQAGKRSEKDFLDIARQHSAKTIAVVNRIDRISPDEVQDVLDLIAENFEGYFAAIVPVSSQKAYQARLAQDKEAFSKSGFPDMFEALKAQVLEPVQELKRESLQLKVAAVISEVEELAKTSSRHWESLRASIAERRNSISAWNERLRKDLHSAEKDALEQWTGEIHAIAKEIGSLRSAGILQVVDIERYGRRIEDVLKNCEQCRELRLRQDFGAFAELTKRQDDESLGASLQTHALNYSVRLALIRELAFAQARAPLQFLRGRLSVGDLLGLRDGPAEQLPSALVDRLQLLVAPLFEISTKSYLQAGEQMMVAAEDWFLLLQDEIRMMEVCESAEVFGPILQLREQFATGIAAA